MECLYSEGWGQEQTSIRCGQILEGIMDGSAVEPPMATASVLSRAVRGEDSLPKTCNSPPNISKR